MLKKRESIVGVHDETGIGTSGQLLAGDLGGGEVMNPEPRRGHMLALLGFLSVLFLGFESGAQKGYLDPLWILAAHRTVSAVAFRNS